MGSGNKPRGFTLVELMVALVVLMVGIVAVAQLVPASILSNASARNDSSALVFAQRELTQMLSQPLDSAGFVDAQGFACNLGDAATPNQAVGSPVKVDHNRPLIDFSTDPVAGYSLNYQDPNDPTGTTYDVRWSVVITENPNKVVTAKRFILGATKRGGKGLFAAVTLDTLVEK